MHYLYEFYYTYLIIHFVQDVNIAILLYFCNKLVNKAINLININLLLRRRD